MNMRYICLFSNYICICLIGYDNLYLFVRTLYLFIYRFEIVQGIFAYFNFYIVCLHMYVLEVLTIFVFLFIHSFKIVFHVCLVI